MGVLEGVGGHADHWMNTTNRLEAFQHPRELNNTPFSGVQATFINRRNTTHATPFGLMLSTGSAIHHPSAVDH